MKQEQKKIESDTFLTLLLIQLMEHELLLGFKMDGKLCALIAWEIKVGIDH